MIIQANIDKSDVLDALSGSRRGFKSTASRLGLCCALLVFVTLQALWGLYAYTAAAWGAAAARADAPLFDQARGFAVDMGPAFLSLIALGLVALLWKFLYRAVKTLRNGEPTSPFKHGLTLGKRVIDMSERHLVVKTPLKAQKIAWASFQDFEETKTSLIFHRANGRFEFVPKGAMPPQASVKKLCAELAQRVATPISRAAGDEAALRLTYEFTDADMNALRRWRRRECANTLSPMRRLIASPQAVVAAFAFLAALSAVSLVGAVLQLDLSQAIAGFGYAAAAGALALTRQEIFSRALSRLLPNRPARCGATDPTTITLSKTGVFRECRGVSEVYQWDAFDELVQTKTAAYLYFGGERALALPKRAFMDEAHYEHLVGFATVRLAEAKRAKTSAQMNRLHKSAAKPDAAPAPIAQKSRLSVAAQSDDSPAAPAHRPRQPIRVARAR